MPQKGREFVLGPGLPRSRKLLGAESFRCREGDIGDWIYMRGREEFQRLLGRVSTAPSQILLIMRLACGRDLPEA